MLFEWDENKNRINKAKHKVDFATAASVFNDPYCASRIENADHYEERWQTIGYADNTLLLLVVHTCHSGEEIVIRIISARKVEKHERERYENGAF